MVSLFSFASSQMSVTFRSFGDNCKLCGYAFVGRNIRTVRSIINLHFKSHHAGQKIQLAGRSAHTSNSHMAQFPSGMHFRMSRKETYHAMRDYQVSTAEYKPQVAATAAAAIGCAAAAGDLSESNPVGA